MSTFTGSAVERATLAWLASAGWRVHDGLDAFEKAELVEDSNVHFLHIAPSPNTVGCDGNSKRNTKASSRTARTLGKDGLCAIQKATGSGLPTVATTENSSVVRVEGSRGSRIRRCTSRRLPERATGDVGQVTVSKLGAAATTKEFLAVQTAGSHPVNRSLHSFNLDAVLSTGYRGKSLRSIPFRPWATRILREHLLRQPTSREHRGLNANAFIKVTV